MMLRGPQALDFGCDPRYQPAMRGFSQPSTPPVVPRRRHRIGVLRQPLRGEHVDTRPEQLGPYGAFRLGTHNDLVTTLGLAQTARHREAFARDPTGRIRREKHRD